MTEEVTTYKPSQFPALRGEVDMTKMLKVLQDNGAKINDLVKVGPPAGGGRTFEIDTLSGPKASATLDVVILNTYGRLKAWWAKDSNDSSDDPPDCVSYDAQNGHGNNRMDLKPEGKGEHDCLSCPHNQFGSSRKGGKGKDCVDSALLVTLRVGSRLPMLVKVPTMSLAPMKAYMFALSDHPDSLDSCDVVTQLSLETDKSKTSGKPYSFLKFTMAARLPKEEADVARALAAKMLNVVNPQQYAMTSGDLRGPGDEKKNDDPAKAAATSAAADLERKLEDASKTVDVDATTASA